MARTRCTAVGVALCAIAFTEPTAAQTANGVAPTETTLQGAGGAPPQAAAARRVVLLDAPEPLQRALRTALLPWGMQLDGVVRDKPESTLPGTALRARELAQELGAEALVWVSANGDGAALWIYESAKDTIRARPFPDRPLDDALAAALALSVKTWLRTSAVPAEAPEPPATVPSSALAVPLESNVLVSRDSPVPLAAKGPPPPEPERPRSRVLIHAGVREGALDPDQLEARYGVELRATAWRSGTAASGILLAAQMETGGPTDANNPLFRGTYFHWGAGLSLGFGQRLTPVLSLNLLAGVAIEHATLWGTLLPGGIVTERSRWPSAAQLRPELELSLGPLGLVLQPVLYVARPRQYAVDHVVVFRTRTTWAALGGALSIDLF
jgi:hypothetical protein